MGADVKRLRSRIKSVDSTSHITGAMGLVASSKIRKATAGMEKARAYSAALTNAVDELVSCPECRQSPYLRTPNDEAAKDVVIVVGGDRGLAGGYNSAILKLAKELLPAEVVGIGKRVFEKYGGYSSAEAFSTKEALTLAKRLCKDFCDGKTGRIGIAYTEYVSVLSQEPTVEWLLPLKPKRKTSASPIFEPDEATALEKLAVTYVAGKIFAAVKESFACEIAARKVAMDAADKNAKKLKDELILQYNRARQGAITQEITEIVAGSGE